METYLPSLTPSEKVWFAALMDEIWKPVRERLPHEAPMPRETKRICSEQELNQLYALIKVRDLICTLSGYGWFNGVMLNVFDHAIDPEDEPRHLVSVCHEHLGFKKDAFKRAYEIFYPIAAAPLNLQFLTFYKFDHPKPRAAYEY